MTRLAFDLESDGFIGSVSRLHCICTQDLDTGEKRGFGPDDIDAGINHLLSASELIGHNIIAYDLPVLRKLYPGFSVGDIKITDTLTLSRLIHADLRNEDFIKGYTQEQLPRRLHGSHSLKGWGLRLGMLKGNFGETTDWAAWSPEMQSYCQQDVAVTVALYNHLEPHKWSEESIRLEHSLAEVCYRIGQAGWQLDQKKAGALYAKLAQERAALQDELAELFPAWTVETEFVPKVNNSRYGYVKGEPFIKRKEVQFNPSSRKHIEFCLRQKYGWKPKEFTPNGDAKIDETVLNTLPFPEAKKLAHSFLLQKRIGQLAEGNQAWLKLVEDDGRVRHTINSNGAVTGRCTHFNFNASQVPRSSSPYGKECRELFTVPDGYVLVGSDLSGLELRCLAHYLQDGGAYAKEVLEGDVHTANMAAAGLATRDQAKTFIYAWLYGAGDAKIGSIVGAGAKEGKRLKAKFLEAYPALAALLRAVKATMQSRGYLTGLDGRRLFIRSEHAALNTLLQSAGALICKRWVELIDKEIRDRGIDAYICGFIHDEAQICVRKGAEHDVCDIARRCAKAAGEHWKLTIEIAADATVGTDWSTTH